MRVFQRYLVIFLLASLLFGTLQTAHAQDASDTPVVRAVLFYSNTCGHCEYVITQVLPPLFEQYGDQLQIIGVSVSSESGSAIFSLALEYFGLESGGVPFLVVGDTYLVGSLDIPEQFPGMVEDLLAQGGVDWPDIPGLDQVVESANQQAAATTSEAGTPTDSAPEPTQAQATAEASDLLGDEPHLSLGERLAQDPAGNALSIVILVGMIAAGLWAVFYVRQEKPTSRSLGRGWAIPVLCLIGLVVAGYMAFVETAQVQAVCGPVGDCNTVQQSQYAYLFGVLPVGILGLGGYIAILLAWAVNRYGNQRESILAAAVMLAMTTFGLLFSIYLTFLEPFVIGASCAWCLSSALIMTLLFLVSLPDGKQAWGSLRT